LRIWKIHSDSNMDCTTDPSFVSELISFLADCHQHHDILNFGIITKIRFGVIQKLRLYYDGQLDNVSSGLYKSAYWFIIRHFCSNVPSCYHLIFNVFLCQIDVNQINIDYKILTFTLWHILYIKNIRSVHAIFNKLHLIFLLFWLYFALFSKSLI